MLLYKQCAVIHINKIDAKCNVQQNIGSIPFSVVYAPDLSLIKMH